QILRCAQNDRRDRRVSKHLLLKGPGPLDTDENYRYNQVMQNLEPHKLIEASPLFRNLQPRESADVIAHLQAVSFARGTRILERGNWHGQLYIVAAGLVSVLLQEEQHELAVAQLGPGECFGEMSLITGEPPSATVRAEQDTSLLALPQADFLALVGTCPTLLRNINAILAQRLSRTNRQILVNHAAQLVQLTLLDDAALPAQRSLSVHIADDLAMRSQKRVLLLEMYGQDEAVGPRFARHPEQLRPSLLDCSRDHSLLARHRAPTMTPEGQHYAALALLASDAQQLAELENGIQAAIIDVASAYDYVLLITTVNTPHTLVRGIAELSHRSMLIVSHTMLDEALSWFAANTPPEAAVFVAHVPAPRPTIGLQDDYAARLGREVTRLLPDDMPVLARCQDERKTLRQLAPGAELTQAVDFVARFIAHQTVGIAFGGGGARGFAHLGVLEQLVRHSVPVDYIAACSSGIITPGMYLIGKSFAESEEIFLQIQRNIVRWRIPRTSIFSNSGLKRMLRDLCGELRFEDLTTPFAMVAVDLSTRSGVVLDRGLLWQAGLASTALPGIFPPVLVGNHILMDAGMHDPVPIRLLRKMGAHILIASELGGQEPPALESATPWLKEAQQHSNPGRSRGSRLPPLPYVRSPHIVDLILRTYDLAMATIGMHSIREADVVIRPTLHRVSLRQFSEGRKFVAAGREAVEQSLPALQHYLPWLE
ncbi:MAG TPA: cyclic nucleotide-binding and patatin-like phospholipase domain-containing protein, partial [Ktedonobacteraceae bacterium]